ncbi:hypothetical protein ACODT5_00095 [Streptomyces sp. 5.8]|uniref:hypothetical protein n=1 Tax=Streptomyces sp. 5.8 TaxID=3406571 RepID=UPI003BB519A1
MPTEFRGTPMPRIRREHDHRFGTAVITVVALMLAVLGAVLLTWSSGKKEAAISLPEASTAAATGHGAAPVPAQSSSPISVPSPDAPARDEPPTPVVPEELSVLARNFVEAWASHDARHGKDSSYGEAGRRAAALASPALANQLTASQSRSARQWKTWTDAQAQVTATVNDVVIPDGAPAPTAEHAYLRALYTVTTTTAGAPPTANEEHLALEMRRNPSGAWCVASLPFA